MNSCIKWVGGKRLLRKQILAEFPEDYTRYVEVFGGAAWLLFARERDNRVEVYNDRNHNLVNLFRCIKYHGEALQEELKWCLVSREFFEDALHNYQNPDLTDIQRAARFFVLIKCSFGAKLQDFSGARVSLVNTVRNLEQFQERLKNTVIEQMDFEKLLILYDKKDTFFYLDPPYFQAEKYYRDSFSEKDHLRLKEVLVSLKGKFLLTYNDCPFIRTLYQQFPIVPMVRQNNMASCSTMGDYLEIMIKNY